MRRGRRSAIGLGLASLLVGPGACGDAAGPDSTVTVRDSAGVRLVEQGGFDILPRILATPDPVYRLGWDETETTFTFISAGRLLSDGSAVVFDVGERALHRISADGSAATRVGRAGEGPGEFESAASINVMAGDTLVVYDPRLGRLSRFSSDGTFLDAGSWSQTGGVASVPTGANSAGRLTWTPTSFSIRRDEGEPPVRVEGPLITSRANGSLADTVAQVHFLTLRMDGGRPGFNPFQTFGAGSGYGDGFVWTVNDAPEVHWIGLDGTLRQIARWTTDPTPVDDEVWSEYAEAFRRRAAAGPSPPDDQELARRLRDAREAASDRLPYFTFAYASTAGEVWLSEYTQDPGSVASYVRIGSDGVASQIVDFPQAIRILDVRGRRVLGVVTNDWDVQAVVVYRLGSD